MIPFIANLNPAEKQHWLQRLNQCLPEVSIVASEQLSQGQCEDALVAIVANPEPDELRRFNHLAWVQSIWVGVEKMISLPELKQVTIVKMVDPELTNTMAEAVLAWTLYLHREMPAYQNQQRQHLWQPLEYVAARDRAVSVLGTGSLGTAAIHRLQLQGFKVSAWSRTAKNIAGIHHYHGLEQLDHLLEHTDILISLLPLTPVTMNLMDTYRLTRLKPGAGIINFSRADIFDYTALVRLLDQQQLKHAVLDVFNQEPLKPDNPLWGHPQITVLPHISGPTNPETASLIVQKNIRNYLSTGKIPKGIDRQSGY